MRTLADLVSAAVVAIETRPTSHGGVDDSLLFDEERMLVAAVAPRRYRDFVLGRRCARVAVEALAMQAGPILAGPNREPLWPAGVVGAITHTEGYVAAAAARSDEVASIGVDAEPDLPLPPGVERRILHDGEAEQLRHVDPGVAAVDRLIFSAKESVYKAWFPLMGRWLGFHDARIELDPTSGRFLAHLLIDETPIIAGRPVRLFEGRYASLDGVIVTTVEVGVDPRAG